MTNKQIAKRFEFDLEMGRFKSYENSIYIFSRITKKRELIRFLKILKILGYKYKYCENNIDIKFLVLMVNVKINTIDFMIHKNSHTFNILNNSFLYGYSFIDDVNLLPNYIK